MKEVILLSVPLKIFKKPVIKNRLKKLLDESKNKFDERYDKIQKYATDTFPEERFSYEKVRNYFSDEFCRNILKSAIENMLECKDGEGYNITKHILQLLTEEKIEEAINGEIFIEAFSKIF